MKNWQQTRRDVFRLARFLRGSGDVVFLRWSSEKITESTGNVSKALTFFIFVEKLMSMTYDNGVGFWTIKI